jgi:hypothetical protein
MHVTVFISLVTMYIVRKASQAWMVLCVGVFVALDVLASRKQRGKALARKRRHEEGRISWRGRHKNDFSSR